MTHPSTPRLVDVDAADTREWRLALGLGGVPGPTAEHPQFPDLTARWAEAGVRLVRSYDWVSRLDTRNNPQSLFPDWSADPTDPASYNFAATDTWVNAVHAAGAEVLFTFASSIPQNKLPAEDPELYGVVVEHIVRHYAQGWAGGPATPIRMFEFGDQPDLAHLHFDGPAEAFFEMYAAFCAAVQRVDATLEIGGPSLAFALNEGADYRDGFLAFVRERGLPLHFFSYLWFTDATRDPQDFVYVAREMRALLDDAGFTETRLMLSYWNYLAVPSSDAPSDEKAAFQAVAAITLQDTVNDYALFFRADSGRDPHYGFVDPAGIYDRTGAPDERAVSFTLIGRAMQGERVAASGGDESGFACLASRDGDRVRVLVANFEAPESALAPRESDEFRFRIPIGESRIELGFRLPPQRAELASTRPTAATVRLRNLPWAGQPVAVSRRTLRGTLGDAHPAVVGSDGSLEIPIEVGPQSVTLLEVIAGQASRAT